MKPAIDRGSPLPFYHQLKQRITEEIKANGLQPGDRVPGDHQLCREYDVSRTVVRQALSELETEGVVERVKGRGTFVSHPKTAEYLVQSLTGLFEDVAARGGHLRSEVRRLEVEPADEAIARQLEVDPGTPVVVVERLRFVNDEPWVLTVTHIPARLVPGLVHFDLRDVSLYAVMENDFDLRLVRGRRSVEAVVASLQLGRTLGISKGAAVLLLRSVGTGVDGRPLEAFVAFHRGDRSRFEVELLRQTAAAAAPLPLMHVTD